MTIDLASLCEDVLAEHRQLAELLQGCDESDWNEPTPADGWVVRDQIVHLAYFDESARTALTEAATFERIRDGIADIQLHIDGALRLGDGRSGVELLSWWEDERTALVAAARPLQAGHRVPWFGPSMSLASCLTARLMETWAHGQDVVDALSLRRTPTARLRHVAHLGVVTREHSYRTRGLAAPGVPVRVELEAPDGSLWTWGPTPAENRVSGSAVDFCLVVTQRRHVDDTALTVAGSDAKQWMRFAQAYAGPPGAGRARSR